MAKILFLSHRVPYPPDKGEKIRAYHILRHLAERHDLWLGTLALEPGEDTHLGRLEAMCHGVHIAHQRPIAVLAAIAAAGLAGRSMSVAAFANAELERWCREIMRAVGPDIVFAYSSAMAQYARDHGPAAVIVDFVDVDSEKYRQYGATRPPPLNMLYRSEAQRLLKFERAAALGANACLFVSASERDLFAMRAPETTHLLHVVANGVDAAYFNPAAVRAPAAESAAIIGFTGRMDYHPNVDAVTWFARAILPRVRAVVPHARFEIVGSAPTPVVRELARGGDIIVTGAVPDVRPYYARADVCVAPLRIARGIQNKVLEAMAMARPAVVTPAALDGIAGIDGEHVLVATDEDAFAHKVIAVLQGTAPPSLGPNARARVLSHHAWDAHLAKVDAIIAATAPR